MKKLKALLRHSNIQYSHFSKANLLAFILVFACIGGYLLLHSFAAGTTANLWVDTDGGTCTRAATAVIYDTNTACSTLQAAYNAAQPGDLVLVKGGNYAAQSISGTKSSPGITIQGANSETVQFGVRTSSTVSPTGLSISATNLTLMDMIVPFWDYAGTNVTLKNISGDTWTATGDGLTVDGGNFGPYDPPCSGSSPLHDNATINAGNNDVIKNSVFHDTNVTHCPGSHIDCFQVANVTGLVVDSNKFLNCWSNGVIFTGDFGVMNNITFQNNWVGPTISGNRAFNWNATRDCPGSVVRNNTFISDTNANSNVQIVCSANSSTVITGNIFSRVDSFECGFSAMKGVVSYNVGLTGTASQCGTNAKVGNVALVNAPASGSLYTSYDYHIGAASIARGAGNPSSFPSTDIDGDNRASPPDAGADEYISPSGSANIFVAANGSDTGANCKRFGSVQANPDNGGTSVCASFNKAYQMALASDIVAVAAGNYGNQFFNAHSPAMTSPGVSFNAIGGTVSVGQIDFGDDSGNFGSGRGTQHVDWITFKGPVSANNTTNIRHTTNVTLDGWTWNQGFASRKSIFLIGDTDKTTITHSDICCTQDDKIIESTVPAPNFGANSNLTISYSSIHSMRRTASTVHNECFLAPAVPGFTLIGTKWYGCTVMNINIGAFGDSAPYSQSNFHWVNNVFESPTDLTETDKTGFPFFQGCNTPAPATMPGWLVEYNIFETGWYDSCGGATGLTLRDNIGSIGNSCPSGVSYSKNIWKERTCNVSDTLNANILSTSNFAGSASHDWHYTSSNSAIDKGDSGNYPALDADGNGRYSGLAPDAGAYEFGSSTGTSTPGDLNNDSHVNILDLSILLSHYGQSATSSQGDCNNDGTINIVDLSILLSHYGT